jgi:hypothetical protein
MDFWIRVASLLRRRWVVVPAVLAALTMGLVAYLATPKSYESTATMVLTTTEFGGTESRDPTAPSDLTNPLLNFSESLRTTAAILIQAMGTNDVAKQLGMRDRKAFVVDDGRSNPYLLGLNGPFVFISVKSSAPNQARDIVLSAQDLMRWKLYEWQASLDAPERTYVSLADVVPVGAPELDRSRATKLSVVAALFGLLLSLGIAYAADRLRARRQGRGAAGPHDELADGTTGEAHTQTAPAVVHVPPGSDTGVVPAAGREDDGGDEPEPHGAPVRVARGRARAPQTVGTDAKSASTVVVVPGVADLALSRARVVTRAESRKL